MKTAKLILISQLLLISSSPAQVTLEIASDRSVYAYGVIIKVWATITNRTDTVFTMRGSSSCIARLGFNSVKFSYQCTADHREFRFSPGDRMTWTWHLNPTILGIPAHDGEQTIRVWAGPFVDSIMIQAPKYFGGQVTVSIPDSIPDQEIQPLRDSLNVTVLSRYHLSGIGVIHEEWQIKGHAIDSVILAYKDDYRLNVMVPNRIVGFDQFIITSVPSDEPSQPELFQLSQNYPNPFNPTTKIDFRLFDRGHARLTVYDIMGRLISVLTDNILNPGLHTVTFDASDLPSGVYLYKLQTHNSIASRSMIFVK